MKERINEVTVSGPASHILNDLARGDMFVFDSHPDIYMLVKTEGDKQIVCLNTGYLHRGDFGSRVQLKDRATIKRID